ncbi:MAG: winged helix-turn-helix domain-containing protein [Phycisphaerales bacterium]
MAATPSRHRGPSHGRPARRTVETIPPDAARRVLLRLQALDGPRPRSSPRAVERLVDRLGYVQVDSINVLDRAHDRILATRLAGYRPEHLRKAIEQHRSLFEHWTHDASVVPVGWVRHWKHRFRRHASTPRNDEWWRRRFGPDPQATLRRVLQRLRREGPLRTRDLERPERHRGGAWWNWHPEKAAVEHLWRCGRVAIAGRENFEKVYDLFERVVPRSADRSSSPSAHLSWACREAMTRLGIATAAEVAAFFEAVPVAEARTELSRMARRGEIVEVLIDSCDGGRSTAGFARTDWARFAGPIDHDAFLPLSPFDPVVRDRRRLARLFGFEYRFEAFTPAPRRRHGYYVLPLLDGDRFVARIDPRFDRAAGELLVRGPWWEPDVPRDRRRLEDALDRLAEQIGADRWRLERPDRPRTR